MKMWTRAAFVAAVLSISPWTVYAQDAPSAPPVPPAAAVPAPAPAVAPVLAQVASVSASETDHAQIIRTIGIEVVATGSLLTPTPAPAAPIGPITAIGIRDWFREKIAFEAGLALLINHISPPFGGGATTFGFGVAGGLPFALGIHKHITTFVEPSLDFFLLSPPAGSTAFQMDILGSLGFEWQLGFSWLETPTLAVLFKLGAGLHLTDIRSTSEITFQTEGNQIGGVVQGTFGLVFYL